MAFWHFNLNKRLKKTESGGETGNGCAQTSELMPAVWTPTGATFNGKKVFRKGFSGTVTASTSGTIIKLEAIEDPSTIDCVVGCGGWWERQTGVNFVQLLGSYGSNYSSSVILWFGNAGDRGIFFYSTSNVARTNAQYAIWIEACFPFDLPPVSP